MSGRVIRIAPATESLEDLMSRAFMAGSYCLDEGLDLSPEQLSNIMVIARGTHGYFTHNEDPS